MNVLNQMLQNPKYRLMLIVFIVLLVLYVGFITLHYAYKKQKQKITRTVDYGSGRKNYFIALTRFYEKVPVLRSTFKKVKKQISMMFPSDNTLLQKRATDLMSRSLVMSILIIFAIIVLNTISGFDIVYMVTGIAMTYILFNEYIGSQCEKLEKKLLEQFGDFISEVRHNYHNLPMPDTAVYDTIDHLPSEMALHAERIYEVFSSTEVEIAAGTYADTSPNRFFTTFVAIGASAMEHGDNINNSSFLLNLNYLKEEVDIELTKKEENDYKFSGLIFVAMFPVFLLKPVEIWMVNIIPELASWYNGLAGTIISLCMIPFTILCYQLLKSLKNRRSEEIKDHKWLDIISNIPLISTLLNKEINKRYTKNQRIGDSLKLVGDDITPKQFLLKRCIWCIGAIVIVNLLFVVSDFRERLTILKDFTSSFQTSIVPSSSYRDDMKEVTKTYVNLYRKETNIDIEKLSEKIMSETSITVPQYASMVAETVRDRVWEYRNVYYRYYFLILSLIAGGAGFYIPYWMLLYKKRILSQSMADEVNQFQTIIRILMNEDGITLDTVLEWLERFSYCFKASIEECIIALERSSQDALQDMKAKETFPAFRRFCDKLMSVDSVGIRDAFDEIDTDRAYYIQKRQLDNKKMMDNKSSIAKMICFIPLLYLIFLQLLLPFMSYGGNMMNIMNGIL